MSESSRQKFGGKQRKQTFLPTTLSFGDFIICATKSYDKIEENLQNEYHISTIDPWSHYDLEGYIHACRKSQKLGDYIHHENEYEESFKNMELIEVQQKIEEQEREIEEKRHKS